jgi:hypothetical protein
MNSGGQLDRYPWKQRQLLSSAPDRQIRLLQLWGQQLRDILRSRTGYRGALKASISIVPLPDLHWTPTKARLGNCLG